MYNHYQTMHKYIDFSNILFEEFKTKTVKLINKAFGKYFLGTYFLYGVCVSVYCMITMSEKGI